MEVHPGVFTSSTTTEDWEPDPEVPGTEMHVLVESGGVSAGMTRMLQAAEPIEWTPPQRETIHVLEGSVRIEIADGPTLELGPGDLASLAPGVATTWHVQVPFQELWVIA
jgi:uncharacterized cupin superfamily protein